MASVTHDPGTAGLERHGRRLERYGRRPERQGPRPECHDPRLERRGRRLERRCRRLLIAYPPDYRARRGDELIATMLDVAGPGRSAPRLADAVDLVASGLRERVAPATPAGLEAGLAVAAPVAVAIAAGISLFAWWRVEPMGVHTVGPVGYAAWLVAAAGWLLPRPALRRLLVALATVVTLTLPLVATSIRVERPPLWVLMALSAFGLLALAGTAPAMGRGSRLPWDERLAVPAGAVAVTVCAAAVTAVWPASGGVGYYYQPTIARVGVVIAIAMAVMAVITVVRLIRGGNAQSWLWATILLGLPAGWFGPFDSAGLRRAADQEVPQFGRLAQVLLASSVTIIAMAWLARRSAARATAARGSGRPDVIGAGWVTLGSAAGLAAFTAVAGSPLVGFAQPAGPAGLPRHVVVTLIALVLAGLCGVAAGPGQRRALAPLAAGFGPTAGAAWLVAAYGNSWTVRGWTDFANTTCLVMTLAFVPFTYGVIVAARALSERGRSPAPGPRVAAAGLLAVSLGWIGYVALPYVLLWGPVLVIVLAGAAVFVLSGRRGASSAILP